MFAEHFGFEIIFLAAVALIVVGPKDLPILMRKVGQVTAKMRGLAAEFRASFEELARQSELDELRKEVEALRQGQLGLGAHQAEIEREFDEIHHSFHAPSDTGSDYYPPGEPAEAEDDQPDLPFNAPPGGEGEAPELPFDAHERAAAPPISAQQPEPQGVRA